jgi:hypothetical protein
MKPKILGIFEKVDFPEFNITGVDAKIDSGAFTGALHCTKVIQEETNPVIIGRRFISKHRFLVDVNMSYSKRLIIKRTEKI